jgi:hypothetical protein
MKTTLDVWVQAMFVSVQPDGTTSVNWLNGSVIPMGLHSPSLRLKPGCAPKLLDQLKGKPTPPDGLVTLQMVIV